MRVDKKGRVFEALVLAKTKGELEIEPIECGITCTTASAGEVICHWAKRVGRDAGSRPESRRTPADPARVDLEPQGERMNDVTADMFGRIPEGMKWCPHCNGYGSSLKEASGRCTHCGGSGLVWADGQRPVTGRNGEPSARQ